MDEQNLKKIADQFERIADSMETLVDRFKEVTSGELGDRDGFIRFKDISR